MFKKFEPLNCKFPIYRHYFQNTRDNYWEKKVPNIKENIMTLFEKVYMDMIFKDPYVGYINDSTLRYTIPERIEREFSINRDYYAEKLNGVVFDYSADVYFLVEEYIYRYVMFCDGRESFWQKFKGHVKLIISDVEIELLKMIYDYNHTSIEYEFKEIIGYSSYNSDNYHKIDANWCKLLQCVKDDFEENKQMYNLRLEPLRLYIQQQQIYIQQQQNVSEPIIHKDNWIVRFFKRMYRIFKLIKSEWNNI